jgi:hypothetical protein
MSDMTREQQIEAIQQAILEPLTSFYVADNSLTTVTRLRDRVIRSISLLVAEMHRLREDDDV